MIIFFRLHHCAVVITACSQSIDHCVSVNCSIVRIDIISVKTRFFVKNQFRICFDAALRYCFVSFASFEPITLPLLYSFCRRIERQILCRTSTSLSFIKFNVTQKGEAMKWNIQIRHALLCHNSSQLRMQWKFKLMMLWLTPNECYLSSENCGSHFLCVFRCNNK